MKPTCNENRRKAKHVLTHAHIHTLERHHQQQTESRSHSFIYTRSRVHTPTIPSNHVSIELLRFLVEKKEEKFPPAKGENNGNKRRGENIRKHALAESLGSGIHTDSKEKEKKKQQSHSHTHKRVSGGEKSADFFFLLFLKM